MSTISPKELSVSFPIPLSKTNSRKCSLNPNVTSHAGTRWLIWTAAVKRVENDGNTINQHRKCAHFNPPEETSMFCLLYSSYIHKLMKSGFFFLSFFSLHQATWVGFPLSIFFSFIEGKELRRGKGIKGKALGRP